MSHQIKHFCGVSMRLTQELGEQSFWWNMEPFCVFLLPSHVIKHEGLKHAFFKSWAEIYTANIWTYCWNGLFKNPSATWYEPLLLALFWDINYARFPVANGLPERVNDVQNSSTSTPAWEKKEGFVLLHPNMSIIRMEIVQIIKEQL